jgi:hypothetical protein
MLHNTSSKIRSYTLPLVSMARLGAKEMLVSNWTSRETTHPSPSSAQPAWLCGICGGIASATAQGRTRGAGASRASGGRGFSDQGSGGRQWYGQQRGRNDIWCCVFFRKKSLRGVRMAGLKCSYDLNLIQAGAASPHDTLLVTLLVIRTLI